MVLHDTLSPETLLTAIVFEIASYTAIYKQSMVHCAEHALLSYKYDLLHHPGERILDQHCCPGVMAWRLSCPENVYSTEGSVRYTLSDSYFATLIMIPIITLCFSSARIDYAIKCGLSSRNQLGPAELWSEYRPRGNRPIIV